MREIDQLVARLRQRLAPKSEHHPGCDHKKKGKCDCYARLDHEDHEILDRILKLFEEVTK